VAVVGALEGALEGSCVGALVGAQLGLVVGVAVVGVAVVGAAVGSSVFGMAQPTSAVLNVVPLRGAELTCHELYCVRSTTCPPTDMDASSPAYVLPGLYVRSTLVALIWITLMPLLSDTTESFHVVQVSMLLMTTSLTDNSAVLSAV
jgi:hypothetical protein